MTKPLVSIILPTFNRAQTIARAVRSVQRQTEHDWELIVIDDGSTDDTVRIVRDVNGLSADRLLYIKQENAGASAARNAGIDHARGKFVAFLDSDDEFAPAKLERQLQLFHRRPDLGCVFSDFSFVDTDVRIHPSYFREKCPRVLQLHSDNDGTSFHVCPTDFFDYLLREYYIATITGMVRRATLGSEIRFAPALCYAEEWLFYLRVARSSRLGFVDEPLSLHHHTKGSLARTNRTANTLNAMRLTQAVLRTFPDLTKPQRRMLKHRYSDGCRQLGYDAWKAGALRKAAHHFHEALASRVSLRTIREWAGSILCQASSPLAKRGAKVLGRDVQPTTESVR